MNASPIAAPGPARLSRPPPPQGALRTLLLASMHERWRTLRAELKRCQQKPSEETVHDLRVAMRRLTSTLDLLASLHPAGNLRKARRWLKKQLNLFGPLRDAQVQLRTVEKMLPSFPELQEFYGYLVRREDHLARRLDAKVKHLQTRKLKKALGTVAHEVDNLLTTPARQHDELAAACGAVDAAFDEVVQRKLAIGSADSAAIHRMRVAFKKFRYMVESLAPMLDWVTSKRLRAMNALQSSMGDIQDTEVLLRRASKFARKHRAENGTSLAPALEELARRRALLTEAFLASADIVFTFWPPVSPRRRS